MALPEKKKFDLQQIVTDKILDELDNGRIPWQKPWAGGNPKNLISKKEYQGINRLLLACNPFKSNYYLSFLQAKELGGHIKAGEKSCMVVFWSMLEGKEKESGEKTKFPFLKYSNVFNVEQCEGIKIPENDAIPINEFTINEHCEKIISEMPLRPEITFKSQAAYYSSMVDNVNMPDKETFKSENHYYATLFHELVHSTGHKKRCDRELGNKFGNEKYSKEELIAEIGANFLCSMAGIDSKDVFDNSIAYIQGWSKKFSEDKKMIIEASGKASKAFRFICNDQIEDKE